MSIQTWARWYSTIYSGGYSLPQQLVSGFPCRSVGKESAYNAGDLGLIPGSGRSPGEGNGNPLQYSCLQNPMDRGAWWATVHGVTRVRHGWATRLPLPLPSNQDELGLRNRHRRHPGRVTCQKSRSSYLKCHPQPKTKDDVEGREIQFWVFTKKSKIRLLCRFKSLSSPLRSFRRFGHPPLPGTAKEMPLQMEISLTNGNVSYKNVNPTWFSELLTWLLFLRNNQLKIINMPKTHILGWRILFPYTFRSIVP